MTDKLRDEQIRVMNQAEAVYDADIRLFREALDALQEIDEALIPMVVGDNALSMMARKVRDAIAKLEARLLNE